MYSQLNYFTFADNKKPAPEIQF